MVFSVCLWVVGRGWGLCRTHHHPDFNPISHLLRAANCPTIFTKPQQPTRPPTTSGPQAIRLS